MTGEIIHLATRRIHPLHMMTAGQQEAALDDLRRSRQDRDRVIEDAYRLFNNKIRAYEDAGIPVTDIAEAAGLTRQRIYQIRNEK